ncbi:MAG: hypothetical protein QOE90_1875 [Thermoplasmata archaeon]|jgi:hypothetical protein|nr:hypothetical protein [Thermoplasmata archaeon]
MGFVGSRPFVVAVVVAVALLALGVGAFAADRAAFGFASRDACAAPAGSAGHELLPARTQNGTVNGRPARTVTFDVDGLANATGARLLACATVGDITLGASPDAKAHVTFTIVGRAGGALDASEVRVALHGSDLDAWVARLGESRGLFGLSGASADVEVLLPISAPLNATVTTTTGDVGVTGVLLGNADVHTTTGDVRLAKVDLQGNLTVGTTTGDQDVGLDSVTPGNVTLRSTTGDVTLHLPRRADVGYDARGDATTGDVSISLGNAEVDERSEGHAHVRTQGFATKPTQVVVGARTTTGDVHVSLA